MQYCPSELPADNAAAGEGIIGQAMTSKATLASITSDVERFFPAEIKWYKKHEKSMSKKQKKLAKKIGKALVPVLPLYTVAIAEENTFTADMLDAGEALVASNCAQAQADLTKAQAVQKAIGSEAIPSSNLGKYAAALEAVIELAPV